MANLVSGESLSYEESRELGVVAQPLKAATTAFLTGELTADEFEAAFLEAFQLSGDTYNERVGAALDDIFFAVDDYVGHGMTVDHSAGDLDGGQLLARAKEFAELAGFEV